MRNVSDEIVQKIKICILYSVFFFRKTYRLLDNVEKFVVQPDKPQITTKHAARALHAR